MLAPHSLRSPGFRLLLVGVGCVGPLSPGLVCRGGSDALHLVHRQPTVKTSSLRKVTADRNETGETIRKGRFFDSFVSEATSRT
ncbi:hypothetical protein TNCV_4642621 [Trichonephila clavipes]|nr:hypothetical protein TNCV_4642621 [Trichonephila clavipes]